MRLNIQILPFHLLDLAKLEGIYLVQKNINIITDARGGGHSIEHTVKMDLRNSRKWHRADLRMTP